MKLLKIILLLGLVIIITNCAKANDPVSVSEEDSCLQLENIFETVGFARDLDIQNNKLFIAEDEAGFSIYDLNNNNLISRFHNKKWDYIRLIAVYDTLVFVWNQYGEYDGIRYLSIKNLDNIFEIDGYSGTTTKLTNLTVSPNSDDDNGFCELSWNSDEIYCYRANYSEDPDFGAITVNGGKKYTDHFPIYGFDYENNYHFLSAGQLGVKIMKEENEGLVEVSTLNTQGESIDVVKQGGFLYTVNQEEGVTVADVANLLSPKIITNLQTTGYAQNLDVKDNILAVASGGGGLYLYDISDKNCIKLLENIDDSQIGYTYKVKLVDDKVYAATKKGVYCYKILNK